MNKDEMKIRTKEFALRTMKLCLALQVNPIAKVISNQLLRSVTSVAANYRAACRARSKAEFISKLGIVEEESDESSFWLELVIEGNILKAEKVMPLLNESNEITAIIVQSIKSARN